MCNLNAYCLCLCIVLRHHYVFALLHTLVFQRALVRGSLVAMDILQTIGRNMNTDEPREQNSVAWSLLSRLTNSNSFCAFRMYLRTRISCMLLPFLRHDILACKHYSRPFSTYILWYAFTKRHTCNWTRQCYFLFI